MFVTGPNVVKTVTHEEVSAEELGGASAHSVKSGVTHFSCANELACIEQIKALLSYLPQNCEELPPETAYSPSDESRPALDDLIPENPNQPYDIREVIDQLVDESSFLEVHKDFAEKHCCGYGKTCWPIHRRGRQSTRLSCRCPGYSFFAKSRSFCSLLRLLQYSAART